MSDGSSYEGVGVRPSLRRAVKLLRAVQGNMRFLAVLLGAPLLVILLYAAPHRQSYVVEARTLGAQITVLDADLFWKLPPATLCHDLGATRDLRAAAQYRGSSCNPGLFREASLPETELRIPKGVQIKILYQPDGSVLFQRMADQYVTDAPTVRLTDAFTWTEGSILHVDKKHWHQVTLLEFAGDVVIGQEAGSGANGYLIEGRYEVRELFLRQFAPWTGATQNPTTVVSGDLFRGDRVAFRHEAEAPEDIFLTGFIAPLFNTNARGFGIVVSNGLDPAKARIGVKSFGSREVLVKPTWIDRALRDPLLLALTAILGFAVTSLTFALEIRRINNRKSDQAQP